ncbi:hypothetical protein O3P69_013367 [Scylla paramamosain]|uniref:Uncharacterized protein n=1 Tax=Scylla paramamosain TaxID=85552 RepID=A0AAW0U1B0_SCYPA
MDLIAAMLTGMRQEMAVDREAQAQRAREEAERTDQLAREQAERTDQLAREQAERTDQLAHWQAQRVDDQVRHLEDVLQSSLTSLKAETQQYTDQACDSVRNELLDKRSVKTGSCFRGLVSHRTPSLEPGWWQGGAQSTPPFCRHHPLRLPPPAALPAACMSELCSPPLSLSASRSLGKRRLVEYNGKVTWEAYVAQFEMVASAQGWSEAEKALQLATALRGPAVEVLGHMSQAQRACYGCVAEALRRRFGHHHRAEVYWAHLKKRIWEWVETLSQLAQDLETLAVSFHHGMMVGVKLSMRSWPVGSGGGHWWLRVKASI